MRSYFSAPVRSRFACVVVGAGLLAGCGANGEQAQKQRRAPPPVPVAVQTVQPGSVDIYATYPGRVTGKREVQVRSRIEGILIERHYNEGEFVEKGEPLVTIDPRSFVAHVNQRKAQLAQAEAELNQAQQIWERVSRLYEVNAVSEAERDKALARLETAQASVKLAQANLESAQIELSYTTLEAPLSGVTSLQEIDEGALVTPGTLLTTVTELDPVYVLFSVPAEDALMRQKALTAMVQEEGATRTATLILPSGETYDERGTVNFTQSTIDPTTGTVRLRAIFDNSDNGLVPGRFVRVRIRLETRQDAIVIPNKAISDSQQRTRVYVVREADKDKDGGKDTKAGKAGEAGPTYVAKAVPVVLGPTVEDGRIIEKGLEPGDRVITIGLGQVQAGAQVQIKPPEAVALDASAEKTRGTPEEVVTEPAGNEPPEPSDAAVASPLEPDSGKDYRMSTPPADVGQEN